MTQTRAPRLVLVNPNSKKRVYQSLGAQLSAIEPPVWAGLMATFVRNKGYAVEIVDAEAFELSPQETAERVRDLKPDVAAVVVYGHQPSAATQIMPAVRDICQAIQDLDSSLKTVLVGGHAAALPQRTLEEEPVQFVASGEGLQTLLDLLDASQTANPDWSQVRDLWYRGPKGVLFSGKPAPLLQNVDGEMPGIAWDLLPMDRYRAHNWHALGYPSRQPYVAIYTTLGCPYHCTFCCIQAPFKSGELQLGMKETKNSYRFWNPQLVVADLERLVNDYGIRHVKFADEMFVYHKRHVEKICDLLIERNLGLNIWAYARVDTVQEGMLDKLKRAGFNWLAFGIEAANARVRDQVQKGFDQEDITRTIGQVRDAGIHVIGNYIFGLPEDDLSTMQETLDMALDLNCEFGNFYCAMAYPGSPLYQEALANGWALPESWGGYSQHSVDTFPLPTKYLSSGEVLRFRDDAFDRYYREPRYLRMIEEKFGAEALAQIKFMTSHQLERRFATPRKTAIAP